MNARCICTEEQDVLVGSKVIAAGRYLVCMCAEFLDVMMEHHGNHAYKVILVTAGPILIKREQ